MLENFRANFLKVAYYSFSETATRQILPPLLNRYTQHNNVHIWARGLAKPLAVYLTYMQMCINIKYYINKRTEAPKPDTKTPKNQQVEKTRGTCTPDQGRGATLGVLGYASA